jgi:hypothetical protein
MKSVVMIAYIFPPEGNAGTYRPLRFVRHLPAHAWHPVVIANAPYSYERYDPTLLNLVPPETEILSVRNPDRWAAFQQGRERRSREINAISNTETLEQIQASERRLLRSVARGVAHKIEGIVYHPDRAMFWIRPATEAAVEAVDRSGAEVIWATGGPWSSLVVGREVARRTGRPYILDFRDSWTLECDDFQATQPEWARRRNRRLLSRLFNDAQAVVFRYMAEAESYWRAYPGVLVPEKIHLIPNGYDGSVARFDVPRRDRCTLLYTGSVREYSYDTLLEALVSLKKSEPTITSGLRLVFVGEGSDAVAKSAVSLGLTDVIETIGVVPFGHVNQLQSEAHALLLLGWKPARGHEFRGSKIFGYLKAGRPIIGVLPDDDQNRKILRSVGVGTFANIESPSQIAATLRQLVNAWREDDLPSLLPDPAACERYSAERQTQALVCALEGQPPKDAFKPGSCPVPPSLAGLIGPGGWVRPRSTFPRAKAAVSRREFHVGS